MRSFTLCSPQYNKMEVGGHIPVPVTLLTDKGRGYTVDIVAACSRTLIIL